jgi:hypothetical protein
MGLNPRAEKRGGAFSGELAGLCQVRMAWCALGVLYGFATLFISSFEPKSRLIAIQA